MLRASAHMNNANLNLKAVGDSQLDPNLPTGSQLLAFADAIYEGNADAIARTRQELQDVAGVDGAARAALVIGNFEMMNRILDATGVPVPVSMGAITTELGIPAFTGRH